MYTYRTQLIADGRHVTFDLPPEFPADVQRLEVVVIAAEVSPLAQPTPRQNLYQYTDERIKEIVRTARVNRPQEEVPVSDEFLEWIASLPSTGRTREEVDAQIAKERASWGED